MDSPRRLATFQNQRGMALVYIALLMVAFCAFLGLAVDIGYMYVAKGQLQNAADAAALAGASRLPDQDDARDKAKVFAELNPVVPGPDTKVAVSPDDITLGNWNATRSSSPVDLRFQPGTPPINAVKVQARRTEGSIGGPVDLFFSRILDERWSQMGVSATAIAWKPVRANAYFMIDTSICTGSTATTSTTFSPPIHLSQPLMAWTSLLSVPTGPGINVNDLIQGNVVPDVDVCANPLYSSGGTEATTFRNLEAVTYNPNYDGTSKTTNSSGEVTTWTVTVPYADNPDAQPAPRTVGGYAKIRIIKACGAGASTFNGFRSPEGVCAPGENDIVIDQIACVSCADSADMFGSMPSLVQ